MALMYFSKHVGWLKWLGNKWMNFCRNFLFINKESMSTDTWIVIVVALNLKPFMSCWVISLSLHLENVVKFVRLVNEYFVNPTVCTIIEMFLWSHLDCYLFTRGQFGFPVLSPSASVCSSVCVSVTHEVVRAITFPLFQLESPNLDQNCKAPCLRSWLMSLFTTDWLTLMLEIKFYSISSFATRSLAAYSS